MAYEGRIVDERVIRPVCKGVPGDVAGEKGQTEEECDTNEKRPRISCGPFRGDALLDGKSNSSQFLRRLAK